MALSVFVSEKFWRVVGSAHSATKFGDQQLFSEMTLGTFPSMAPYQKSCWHSLYFNCGQVKLDPQKPLFFIAFWVWDNCILIYCSKTNWDRWNLMPACNWACLGLKWVTLRLVQIWPPTWSSMHAKLSHREMSKFQFSKSCQKKRIMISQFLYHSNGAPYSALPSCRNSAWRLQGQPS